jgi:hypothetical protein
MFRFVPRLPLCAGALLLASILPAARAQQEISPIPPVPPAPEAPPLAGDGAPNLIRELGDQRWDFIDIFTAYLPVKGTLDSTNNTAVWTLELVKPLVVGEALLHETIEDSPFRPVFLDEEKVVLQSDSRVQITPVAGQTGDRLRMVVELPSPEIMKDVRHIRIERRTRVGF